MDSSDISDDLWKKISPHIAGGQGAVGRPANDNRLFIDAVLWVLMNNSQWNQLPERYGKWQNVSRRFYRWRDRGEWENILNILLDNKEYNSLIINKNYSQNENQSRSYELPYMRMLCKSEPLASKISEYILDGDDTI